MNIERIDPADRWSEAVVHNDTVYYTSVPENLDADATAQTANALAAIDVILARVGSDKSRVLDATIFLADMVVKEGGFAELIPEADVMIFDEAHQIPDIASQYFGKQLTSRQLLDLAKDISIAYRTEVRDAAQLQKSADRLSQSTQDFRLMLGEPGFRGNLREVLSQPNVQRALLLLDDALELCYDVVKLSLGRSALLDAAFERATLYRARLKRLKEVNEPGFSYWYECNSRHFVLALTPLTVADRFRELLDEKPGSWIFTSATLSVNEQMGHFTDRLGLNKAKTLLLASPFDYAKQALLCVPRFLPSPNQPGGARQLARMLRPLIEANNGRCFFLCTSHQMMRELAEEFRATMTLPVLLQGRPVKDNCWRSLWRLVMRCWWRPVASGKGWTCVATLCRV